MEWRDNHFTKLKEEQKKENELLLENENNKVKVLRTIPRKGIVVFTIVYIIFILMSLLFLNTFKQMNNENREIANLIAQSILYIFAVVSIYFYSKYNSLSKTKIRKSYSLLFISFFIFPFIFQIASYFYLVSREANIEEEINKAKEPKKEFIDYQFKKRFFTFISTVLLLFLTFSYFFGGYKLINEKSYSTKQFIIGLIFPPYTIYIGIDEIFKDDQPKKEEKSKTVKSFDSWIERELNN